MIKLAAIALISLASEVHAWPYDPGVSLLRHQQKCAAVTIAASATQEVCVVWDQPFSQCAFTGNRPRSPCRQAEDCGTSQPCTFLNYWIDTNVSDSAEDMRGIMVHHIVHINGSRACVLAWNQDAASERSGTVCIDGYTGGIE